jgi:hypothetical protein
MGKNGLNIVFTYNLPSAVTNYIKECKPCSMNTITRNEKDIVMAVVFSCLPPSHDIIACKYTVVLTT